MSSDHKIHGFEDVSKHNNKDDCWLIISGKVYNVTPFIDEHPGGDELLLISTGKDATDEFEDVGHSTVAREMLEVYYVGEIDVSTLPLNQEQEKAHTSQANQEFPAPQPSTWSNEENTSPYTVEPENRTDPWVLETRLQSLAVSYLDDEESLEDVPTMSTATTETDPVRIRTSSTKEMVERAKKKKMSKKAAAKAVDATNPSINPIDVIKPPPAPALTKIVPTHNAASSSSSEIHLSFPEDFGSPASESTSLWPDLGKLAFPAYFSGLSEKTPVQATCEATTLAFQSLQSSFYVGSLVVQQGDQIKALESKLSDLEHEKGALAKKLKTSRNQAKRSADLASQYLRVAGEELDRSQVVNAELSAQLLLCRDKLALRKEQLIDASGYYSWLARIECMEEAARGKHLGWKPSEERKQFDEFYKDKPVLELSDEEPMGDESSLEGSDDGTVHKCAATDVPSSRYIVAEMFELVLNFFDATN